MGEEARKHGFSISAQPGLLATKPLAYFTRKMDSGGSQMFEITEYKIFPGRIFLRGAGANITLEYKNEEEFEKCIHHFNDYMVKEGYGLLDDALNIKEFEYEDGKYVKENYNELAEMFIKEVQVSDIATMSVAVFINYIREYISNLVGVDWDQAKPKLMLVAGFIIYYMVNRAGAYIEEDTERITYFVLARDKEGIIEKHSPLKLVYVAYRHKSVDTVLIKILNNYFTKEEIEKV